jgi:cAMP phosphodiesterase
MHLWQGLAVNIMKKDLEHIFIEPSCAEIVMGTVWY